MILPSPKTFFLQPLSLPESCLFYRKGEWPASFYLILSSLESSRCPTIGMVHASHLVTLSSENGTLLLIPFLVVTGDLQTANSVGLSPSLPSFLFPISSLLLSLFLPLQLKGSLENLRSTPLMFSTTAISYLMSKSEHRNG